MLLAVETGRGSMRRPGTSSGSRSHDSAGSRSAAAAEPVAVKVPEWLRRAHCRRSGCSRLELGPLSLGALHELLRARLGSGVARPTLRRVWEASRGNPFFALEIARALQRRGGTVESGDELPIPATLEALVHERLSGLSAPARDVARVVAALADPVVALVEGAVGRRADRGLGDALEARVLELEGQRLRFTHPLLGSVLRGWSTPGERRSLHAKLAEVVPDAEERARHLALATVAPSAEIASVLEDRAREAKERGAPATAAELLEQALRLTPDGDVDDARRRILAAAEAHFQAGDKRRANVLLETALAAAPGGVARAVVLIQLARAQSESRLSSRDRCLPPGARRIRRRPCARGDDTSRARRDRAVHGGRRQRHRACGDGRSRRVTLRRPRPALQGAGGVRAAALQRWTRDSTRGDGVGARSRAVAHRAAARRWSRAGRRSSAPLVGRARRRPVLFEERRRILGARGRADEAVALWYLSLIEWRAGNSSRRPLRGRIRCARGAVRPRDRQSAAWPKALIAAHRGEAADAPALAEHCLASMRPAGLATQTAAFEWVLGFLELSCGDSEAALRHFGSAEEFRPLLGFRDPGMDWLVPDELDALVSIGAIDEAEAVLGPWEQRARTLDRAWALAIAARVRRSYSPREVTSTVRWRRSRRHSPSTPAPRIRSNTPAR